MDLSPRLTDWLREVENAPLLAVTAGLLLAWAIWYGTRAFRRHQARGGEYLPAQRGVAYQGFADALSEVISAIQDEVLASAPATYEVMSAAAGADPTAQDRWWQETVRLSSDRYRQAVARLSTASEVVAAYGSPRARQLALVLLSLARKAGEEHTRRTHHETLTRLVGWLEQGRNRFHRVTRSDLGYGG